MYVHALRSRCAVAVSSGADGVALAQFSTFLYDSTYLVLPKTRRIHHRKAHQILRRNGGARRVTSRRRCASSCCFVSLASLAAHTYKGQTLDFLVIVYYYCWYKLRILCSKLQSMQGSYMYVGYFLCLFQICAKFFCHTIEFSTILVISCLFICLSIVSL